jgi:hypothetical protein
MNSEQKNKRNERDRKRYAEDPEYRETKLAAKRARASQKFESDPQFRENRRISSRKNNWKSRKVTNAATVDYDGMLARQGGVCKICHKPPRTRLCLDHDHANGRVRGLLCHKCNTGLGMYGDDIGRLLRAAAYLVFSGALPALACTLVAATARFFRAVLAGHDGGERSPNHRRRRRGVDRRHTGATRSACSLPPSGAGLSHFAAAFVRPRAEEHRPISGKPEIGWPPHPSRRPHARCVRAPQDEGGTDAAARGTHELAALLSTPDQIGP